MLNKLPILTVNPEKQTITDDETFDKALKESGYTKQQAKEYWQRLENNDPYSQAINNIARETAVQLPKVAIENNKISISAPKSMWDSPVTQQLKTELKSLVGADLSNPEVGNAIKALNKELQTNWNDAIVQQTLGWKPEEYKDYQYTVQSLSGTNPLISSAKIKGKEKDGKIAAKTPKEWLDYYKSFYNTEERTKAFKQSYASNNPYERTMALVMGNGQDKPIYGYDFLETVGQALKAAGNQISKLPEGVTRWLGTDTNTQRVEELSKKLNVPSASLRNFSVTNETQFEDMKNAIRGKSWSQLTDDQKAFVLEVGVSKDYGIVNKSGDRIVLPNDPTVQDLNNMSSQDDESSRNAINNILENNSYDSYKKVRDNYNTWQNYDEDLARDDEELAENAIWASSAQTLGNIAGTVGRYLWEAALTKAATGGLLGKGFNITKISDKIGNNIIGSLVAHDIIPASGTGTSILQFAANLLGTIPEDILQTSIDNVLTYNAEENANLLNPAQMSENFKSNLIIMSLFNAAKAGVNSVKLSRMAKAAAQKLELEQPLEIDVDDITRAAKKGTTLNIEDGKVSAVDSDGSVKELNTITPENGQMIQQSLFKDINWEDRLSSYSKNMLLNEMSSPEDVARVELYRQAIREGREILPITAQMTPDGKLTIVDGNHRARAYYLEGKEPEVKIFDNSNDAHNFFEEEVKANPNKWNEYGISKNIIEASEAAAPEPVKIDTTKIEATEPVKANYDYTPLNEYLRASVQPTGDQIRAVHTSALNNIMDDFKLNLEDFHNKFGDVRTSDFDWVNYQARRGLKPSEIIGTVDPTTNRPVTKEMIDAMKWWSEQPFVKDLRMASRNAIGEVEDFDVLGYLPHTDYNPANASFEEALAGVLWRKSTGASVLDDAGKYKGFGGTFEDRYRTFASNMLWDARVKDIATTKLLDEARMDGQEITPELIENTRRAVDGEQNIQKLVNENESTKDLVKALEAMTDESSAPDFKKFDAEVQKQAENSGLGLAFNENYRGVYRGANTHEVIKQGNTIVNSFDSLGNRMRNTTIEGVGSMYDNGGAALVYAEQNAMDIIQRYAQGRAAGENPNLKDMLVEYIENNSKRSAEYASEIADKWIARMSDIPGEMNIGKAIYSLGNSMKWEAMTRLKRWLALAEYDGHIDADGKKVGGFNKSTRKVIDRFLFNHMQMDAIKNNKTIGKKLSNALNTLTSLRYRALFYGNIKNALLQTSELNRYFTSFKWGDVATMAKRLATDEGFRARVDGYVRTVAPMTSQLQADIYNAYSNVADSMKVEEDGVLFNKIKDAKSTADAIGLGPIEAAEAFKNRMMVAGLVQEADRLGLTGDEALRHIRNRFERVALAANEMGQIGLASNPLAKTMLFLQNFQIRELGMHLYNIKDATGMADTTPKKVLAASNYISKVLGSKLATTLILARLGYSAKQTLGIDPFGLTDSYTGIDKEDMNWVDQNIAGGLLTPFFAGGMMSLISDMYFMARKAYIDSNQETVSDEAEQKLSPSWGVDLGTLFEPDSLWNTVFNFVPGSVAGRRIGQMNQMMDSGWAVSDTGNKMYTAPNDLLNTILGYAFGRSATQNALQYNQSYGDNVFQTLGRFNPFRPYGDFDPIDTENYTDWFKGDANDRQQFEKGRRYFKNERDRILDAYQEAIQKGYSDDEISEAKNDMNSKLNELFDKLERFVDAYESKNGTMDSAMTKQVINLLNIGRNVPGDTESEARERGLNEYSKALDRYAALGLSPVGTYSGATESEPNAVTKYQGSPQWRSAISGYYGRNDEAVEVLKRADERLAPIRNEIKDAVSKAYNDKDWNGLKKLQKGYLDVFDQVVSPIIAAYGNGILGFTDVTDQLKNMLSTGTTSRSGNLIPSDDYRKDKYGRYVSTPFETVDVKKWALQRFGNKLYRNPTVTSNSTAEEDIDEIKRLSRQGKNDSAMVRALVLKTRVDNQVRALSKEQMAWLNNFIKGEK